MRKKIIAVLITFVLTACGSGGGGGSEDPAVDTSGCFERVTKTVSVNSDLTVVSKDLNATVIVDPNSLQGDIDVSITVLCGLDTDPPTPYSFNGRAYQVIVVSGNIVPQYNLIITYDPKGVDERTLQIGTLGDPTVGWQNLPPGTLTQSPSGGQAVGSGLTLNDVAYGIFVASSGGTTGSPPTAPGNPRATSTGTCQIEVSWDQSSDLDEDVTFYNVFRALPNQGFSNIGGVEQRICFGRCTFLDNVSRNPPLVSGSQSYYVRATDAAGHVSPDSVIVSALATGCPS